MGRKKARIRVMALCIFRQGDSIFVAEGYDKPKRERFYRPIGGGVDFCERAADAVEREVEEELGTGITGVRLLGVLESIFTYADEPGHEVCFIFDGAFIEPARNQLDYVVQGTDDERVLYTARYLALDYFRRGEAPLYPDGLLALLDTMP